MRGMGGRPAVLLPDSGEDGIEDYDFGVRCRPRIFMTSGVTCSPVGPPSTGYPV